MPCVWYCILPWYLILHFLYQEPGNIAIVTIVSESTAWSRMITMNLVIVTAIHTNICTNLVFVAERQVHVISNPGEVILCDSLPNSTKNKSSLIIMFNLNNKCYLSNLKCYLNFIRLLQYFMLKYWYLSSILRNKEHCLLSSETYKEIFRRNVFGRQNMIYWLCYLRWRRKGRKQILEGPLVFY